MKAERIIFVCLGILLCSDTFAQGAVVLAISPGHPRLDTNYTVTVSAYGVTKRETAKLSFDTVEGKKSENIYETTLEFEKDDIQEWTVVFPSNAKKQLSDITLTLTSSADESKKPPFQELHFVNDGYTFIQTDKPIYAPGQTIKFRIIAVDEHQVLSKYKIKVEIQCLFEKIGSWHFDAKEAFEIHEAKIPEAPKNQLDYYCTIKAHHHRNGNDHLLKEVTFDVKKYELERFYVKLETTPDVITRHTSSIGIKASALYIGGQALQGHISMSVGTWDTDNGATVKMNFNGVLTRGEYNKKLTGSELENLICMIGSIESPRLYINVTVTERDTEFKQTMDTKVFLGEPCYNVSFANSKTYFKPGFPYTLNLNVTTKDGRPARRLTIQLNGESKSLNDNGQYTETYSSLSGEWHEFKIEVPASSHRSCKTEFKHNAAVDASKDSQYLQISLEKEISKRSDGQLILHYTPPPKGAEENKMIAIVVMSKGHRVFSYRALRRDSGKSTVALPKRLYTEVSPAMRVVASYCHNNVPGHRARVVMDSLVVDTKKDVCVEEVRLKRYQKDRSRTSHNDPVPGEEYSIEVKGGRNMMVGIVAVDEAVMLLSDNHLLTRESMFEEMQKHDPGSVTGYKNSAQDVMKGSGLVVLAVGGDAPSSKLSSKYDGFSFGSENSAYHTLTTSRLERSQPQTRKYFPESWFFQNVTLLTTGKRVLTHKLPDSITRWSFLGVGVSATRGVCVSEVLEQNVEKFFYMEVVPPRKMKRLDEVKIRIVFHNLGEEKLYMKVKMNSDNGLCLFSNRGGEERSQNLVSFDVTIPAMETTVKVIHVIPVSHGDQHIRVEAVSTMRDNYEADAILKKIHVWHEGERIGHDESGKSPTESTKTCPFDVIVEAFKVSLNHHRHRRHHSRRRERRQASSHSRIVITIKVCLKLKPGREDENTRVEVDMLSGFEPVLDSNGRIITDDSDVGKAWYDVEYEKVSINFKKVRGGDKECFSFKASQKEIIWRPMPADVHVYIGGDTGGPSCVQMYFSPISEKSLPIYCSHPSNLHKYECKCITGSCPKCIEKPKDLKCDSKIASAFHVKLPAVQPKVTRDWKDLKANVLSVYDIHSDRFKKATDGDNVELKYPDNCKCVRKLTELAEKGKRNVYVFFPHVFNSGHYYIPDEETTFLSIPHTRSATSDVIDEVRKCMLSAPIQRSPENFTGLQSVSCPRCVTKAEDLKCDSKMSIAFQVKLSPVQIRAIGHWKDMDLADNVVNTYGVAEPIKNILLRYPDNCECDRKLTQGDGNVYMLFRNVSTDSHPNIPDEWTIFLFARQSSTSLNAVKRCMLSHPSLMPSPPSRPSSAHGLSFNFLSIFSVLLIKKYLSK